MEVDVGTQQVIKEENCCYYIPKKWSRGSSGIAAAGGNWHVAPIPEHQYFAEITEASFMVDGIRMSYNWALDKVTKQLGNEEDAIELLKLYYEEYKKEYKTRPYPAGIGAYLERAYWDSIDDSIK